MTDNNHAKAAKLYLEHLCDRIDRGQRILRRHKDWWLGVVGLPAVLGMAGAVLSCQASTGQSPGSRPPSGDRCHYGPEGAVNCSDPACSHLCVGAEYAAPAPDPIALRESACQDSQDNDGDGMVDCGDPDCVNACSVPAYAAPPPVAAREYNCADGVDDDGDGTTDCGDADCAALSVCNAAEYMAPMPRQGEDCGNGIDDDRDGMIDRADPDCTPNVALYAAPPR